MTKNPYFILIILKALFLLDILAVARQNGDIDMTLYGPAEAFINDASTCMGMRLVNVTNFDLKIVRNERNNLTNDMVVNLTVFTSIRLESAKTEIFKFTDGRKVKMWSYAADKPCDHFMFYTAIRLFVNANSKCILPKGNYFVRIDIDLIVRNTFGNSLIYGRFLSKTTAKSKQGVVACINTDLDLRPRNGSSI